MTDKLWHEPDYPLTPQHAVKGVRLITKSGQVLTWSIEHGWKHVAQNNEPFIFFEDAVKMICNYAVLQKKLDKAMDICAEMIGEMELNKYADKAKYFAQKVREIEYIKE